MPIDPWTSLNKAAEVPSEESPSAFLDVIDHRLHRSDDGFLGPELASLFSDKPRIYLLVDAVQRKKITEVFDLDELELDCRCLFKGDAAETWKDVAPYLVDMTLPADDWDDASCLPCFHRSFFSKHWGQSTGIVVQTTASMDAVWRHFRRFTRVQLEGQSAWRLFRFWDPRVAGGYFSGIRAWEERARQFFVLPSETATLSMVIESEGGMACTTIAPSRHLNTSLNAPTAPFRLTADDMALLEGRMRQRFIEDVAAQSAELWPERRRIYDTEKAWRTEIDLLTRQAQAAGLSLDRDIRDYISITIDKGRPFWSRQDVQTLFSQPHLNTATLRMLALRHKLETGVIR